MGWDRVTKGKEKEKKGGERRRGKGRGRERKRGEREYGNMERVRGKTEGKIRDQIIKTFVPHVWEFGLELEAIRSHRGS